MARRKISLIVAGGVSLGSYEAGVLSELLYALEHLNGRSEGDRYTIDVISGGSAGSLTATLMSRLLLHDYPGMKDTLRQAWVVRGDIDVLTESPPPDSLLSSQLLKVLTDEWILGTERYPLRVKEPASSAPESLRLGFSISNLLGIDYGVPYALAGGVPPDPSHFPSTFFSDLATFELDAANREDEDQWRAIAAAASASASFPVVFPPYRLLRQLAHYPGALFSDELRGRFPAELPYVDGGVFDNEPLKPALDLSLEQDGDVLSPHRVFILVDPRLNRSAQDLRILDPERQTFVTNATRLLAVAVGEAQAQDWLRAERTNRRLLWRDRLITELDRVAAALPEGILDASLNGLERQTFEICRQMTAGGGEGAGEEGGGEGVAARGVALRSRDAGRDVAAQNPGEYFDLQMRRIEQYHGASQARRAARGGTSKRDRWFKHVVFLLDHAGGTSDKFPINTLHAVGSEENLLAGDPVSGFGGFFHETWREHDYRVGRSAAHQRLPGILGATPYPREGEGTGAGGHNPLYDPEPDWGDLTRVELADAPRVKRQRFRDVVVSQLDAISAGDPLNIGSFSRWALRRIVKKKLGDFLGL